MRRNHCNHLFRLLLTKTGVCYLINFSNYEAHWLLGTGWFSKKSFGNQAPSLVSVKFLQCSLTFWCCLCLMFALVCLASHSSLWLVLWLFPPAWWLYPTAGPVQGLPLITVSSVCSSQTKLAECLAVRGYFLTDLGLFLLLLLAP